MASSARIEELRKKFEENPRRYFAPLANEYRKAGDIEQAIAICREYLPQQPGHMSGHIVYGQALYEARQVEEAKTVFETALSLDPENLIALRQLGDIALMVGDHLAARVWYGRVLEADPRNEEIQAQLAALDQSQSASATPVASTSQPTPVANASRPTPIANASQPTSSSAPTVVVAAHPRPQPTPPTSQTPTAELHLEPEASRAPTLEVKLDAIPPAAPRVTRPADMDLGLEPTSFAPPPPTASEKTLEFSPAAAPPKAPSIDSFSLEGLETTSLAAEPAAPPLPEPPAPAPPAPPEAPEPGLVDLDLGVPLPAAEAPISAQPAPASDETALLDLGELSPAPETAPPITYEAPTEPLVPASDPLPLLDLETPAPALEDWTPPPPEPVAEVPPAAPTAAGPFVTETMAELYLQQGHRDEALRVYRALLEQRPGDSALAAKVDALSPQAVPDGPTIRELLFAIAARRPAVQPEPAGNGATPQAAPEPGSPDVFASLFGGGPIDPADEAAAAALAAAFTGLNGGEGSGEPPQIGGAPARPAAGDLSLDAVFKTEPQASTPSSFSFDQFFSQRATAEHSAHLGAGAPATSTPESRDEVAQFTRWLEGLKQK